MNGRSQQDYEAVSVEQAAPRGQAVVLWGCMTCSAVIRDMRTHDRWHLEHHDRLTAVEAGLGKLSARLLGMASRVAAIGKKVQR
jgi:hypothetical protein